MRSIVLAPLLVVACLVGVPELHAQGSGIDLPRFDIVGLKLGQTLPEAIEALKKHNPKFSVETRRVGLEKWDNQPGCIEDAQRLKVGEQFGLPNICGNWSDGMGMHKLQRDAQKEVRPDHALVAGLIAYHDQREFGPPSKDPYLKSRSVVRAGEETIALVLTPDPGKETIILISRAKSFAQDTVDFEGLKSQVFEKYATADSLVNGLDSSGPRRITVLNLFLNGKPLTERRDRRAFQDCNSVSIGDYSTTQIDFQRLSFPLPSATTASCGHVIRTYLASFSNNNRYAEAFSVLWFDQHALFKLSRDRVLTAKAILDAKPRPSPPPLKF